MTETTAAAVAEQEPRAAAPEPAGKQKMSIILYSGTVDKLTAASILATGGAAMDMEVNIFLTFWALLAMKKGAWQDPEQMKVSAEFAEYAPMMMEAVQQNKVKPWIELLREAKEIGDVNVYACGMTMDLFGLKLEDLEDIVTGVQGVTGFVGDARDSAITLFI
ncbi:MAG: DsrE/DsrF/DrsH-like family protein [Limnochordales bacterium]|nr:DsrE/DsrF/DrsH-like family protein [Limnochordales bacterium]